MTLYVKSVLHFYLLSYIVTNFIVNSNYVTYGLESERICHRLKRTTLPKLEDISSAVIVTINNHIAWRLNPNKQCKYVIKTKKGEGLIAVIENMYFRRDGTNCLDYVQFTREDRQQTPKFCGHVQKGKELDPDYASPSHVKSEFDMKGEIETEIFISNQSLNKGENINITIIYTPYQACKKNDDKMMNPLDRICIGKSFYCDGHLNCPSSLCTDEENCPYNFNNMIGGNGTGTKVTVGAVTTIFLCFIIFVMCLWICKKHNKLCWSSDCAGPSPCHERPEFLPHEPSVAVSSPVPSAPMLEVAVPPHVSDKDLPPSYDSLFPEHNNPTTS